MIDANVRDHLAHKTKCYLYLLDLFHLSMWERPYKTPEKGKTFQDKLINCDWMKLLSFAPLL